LSVIRVPHHQLIFSAIFAWGLLCQIPNSVQAAKRPSLSVKVKRTRGSRPPTKIAETYATAKKQLAQGQAKAALKTLSKAPTKLLRDRESLVRGDALLAVRQPKQALAAYQAALRHAQTKRVAIRAARAMVKVYGVLNRPKQQFTFINLLLKDSSTRRRARLMLEKVVVLEKLGRKHDAAQTAWQILQDYPTSKIATAAQEHLARLIDKGAKRPANNHRLELARIRNLWKSSSYDRALRALEALGEEAAHLDRAILIQKADLYGHRRNTKKELALRLEAEGMNLTGRQRAKTLERIGRLYMKQDKNDLAISYFTKLAAQFPSSKRVPETQFLSAWLPYNSGDYEVAAETLLGFAQKYPKWVRRPEALWFAAWSAYLAKKYGLARRALNQVLEDHPDSEMGLWSYYWKGKIQEQLKKTKSAKTAYREILKKAPLSYWGHWASTALTRLGEQVILKAPPELKIASIDQALRAMPKNRPVTVDRGIALFEVDLESEAIEELRAASRELEKVKNRKARIMVAEMLGQLGAHHQGFRMAAAITKSGTNLASGHTYAWRAWRLAYPFAYEQEVKAAAKHHKVDPYLVLSIMRTESAFRPWAKSPVGARGLMQVMPKTARRIGRVAKGGRRHANRFKSPKSNIWLGTWYIKRLLERYHQQLPLAIGAYNAGPRPVDRWQAANVGRTYDEYAESITYRETRRYTRRVLETYQTYLRLAGKLPFDLNGKVKASEPPKGSVSF